MLRSYLKTAWRTLRKDKVPTLINVGGLAVGMACCLWLLMFVEHEWSYDRFHEEADRIVRIVQETTRGDGSVGKSALAPPPLGPTLEESVPEADAVVRLAESTAQLQHDGMSEDREVLLADPGFFDLFTFPLVAGNPGQVLASPDQIVLAESEARRLFGEDNPVGRTLTVTLRDETREVRVSGVAEDPPTTSSIPFSFVMPMDAYFEEGSSIANQWRMGLMYTFVRLASGAEVESLEANLQRVAANHFEDSDRVRLYAQPITDIHHSPEFSSGLVPTSDPRYAYILGAIALFILLIAAINFVTLSLGRSARRAREVGVRKSVGATQVQLGMQFWCEAVLVCGVALVGGLLLTWFFFPVFVDLANVPLQFSILEDPLIWLGMAGLMLGVGLLAGGYPAWVLARKEAVPVLRGQARVNRRGGFARGLIVVQFALSVGFVAAAFIMSHQLQYMMSEKADLGYADAPIITLEPEINRDAMPPFEAFKQEAEQHPAVHSVTGSAVTFGARGVAPLELQARTGGIVRGYFNLIGSDYVETMGLEVVKGRSLEGDRRSQGLLVNERLVQALGLEAPIGATLSVSEALMLGKPLEEVPIVGVVADYHVSSMEEEIPPLILAPRDLMPLGLHAYSVRIHTGRTEDGLMAMASVWEQVFPDQPFQYTFLQDRVEGQYEAEQQWRALVGYAALLALLIACFGVFGLAALEVARRRPEIGIRKVVGASAASLVALLSKDLVRLVGMGALLGSPLAYIAMQRWLEHFAYRVEPAWWIFMGAGGGALALAWATAFYHTLQAARMNPTDAIRQE